MSNESDPGDTDTDDGQEQLSLATAISSVLSSLP